MSLSPLEELRLLFSRGSGYGHLSPDMMRCLLPLLPDHLLPNAFHIAVTVQSGFDSSLDKRILDTVVSRLSQAECEELFKEQLLKLQKERIDFHQTISTLAPYLPSPLLKDALNIARGISPPFDGVSSLVALVPHLSEPVEQEAILQEALKIVEASHAWGGIGLRDLAPYLSEAQLQDVVQVALEEARNEEFPFAELAEGQATNLVKLLSILPVPIKHEILQVAQQTVEKILSTSSLNGIEIQVNMYVRAIIDLSVHQPEEERPISFQRALEAAQAIRDLEFRTSTLALLLPHLNREMRSVVVREMLGMIFSMKNFKTSISSLAMVAPYLSRPLLREAMEFLEILESQVEPGDKAFSWCRLAPYLSEPQLLRVIEIAQALTSEKDRAFVLRELAPYLTKRQLLKALEIVQTIASEASRAYIRAILNYYLVDQEQREIAEDQLTIHKQLAFLAPPAGVLQRMLDLLTLISTEERDAVLEEILDTAPGQINLGGGGTAAKSTSELVVNTGFASIDQADQPLMRDSPLACDRTFYFWLEVGSALEESIDEHVSLPPLPEGARLQVALFALTEGVEIPSQAIGELRLQDNGSVWVEYQPPEAPTSIPKKPDLLTRRLFFPVHIHTLEQPGIISLFCNIYYEQILIQSRLIRARTAPPPPTSNWVLRSVMIYKLVDTITANDLKQLTQLKRSIMLAHDPDNLNFCFLGTNGQELFKADVPRDGQGVQDLVEYTRRTLKRVAWGTDQDWQNDRKWQKKYPYRYKGPRNLNLKRLPEDLFRLAISGYRLYRKISGSDGLAREGGRDIAEGLERLMCDPGMVQIAVQREPRFVPPMALVYDYPLFTNAPFSSYTLCPTFLDALKNNTPLEELDCFTGACPTRNTVQRLREREQIVVCPSGFWGYRHALGIPLSIKNGPDVPPMIVYKESLQWLVSFSTDQDLHAQEHLARIHTLWPKPHWDYADTQNKTLDLLENTSPHLVYFYCHGGLSEDGVPYIQVGSQNEQGITPDNLNWQKIAWEDTRPLVFINGCHTTALEPEKAIEFVSTFIECAAAGVIGTEITIFESLARTFAEECLRHFLQKVPIGEAVRRARLVLLQNGNPLGLVYIPFVLPSLRLVEQKI